jgi:hypothetical protein
MQSKSRRWNGGAVLAALLAVGWSGQFLAFSQGAKQPPSATKKARPAVDDFLNPASGPLTLPKLLDLLRLIQQDIETEGRIMRAIEARGVDFSMTPDNAQRILAAGGSEKLRQLLEIKAPPPSPAPPATSQAARKEEAKGTLTVQCEPAECEVAVLGDSPVATRNGAASLSGLKPGETFVDIRKAGYFGQQHPVTIKAGADTSLIVKLDPDSITQVQFGTRLFQAMVEAAGGESVQKDFAALSATGSATLFDSAGTGTEWNLNATFRPGQVAFEARSSAGGLKLDCRGETCQAQTGGKLFAKRLSREQAQALETALRQFRTLHFAVFLDRLVGAKAQATAKTGNIPASGEQHLRLEGASETYNISLDAQLLPALIAVESKTGVGAGLTVGFSDFAAVGASHYPRATEIKFPDGKQGLRVRFSSFNSPPGAK